MTDESARAIFVVLRRIETGQSAIDAKVDALTGEFREHRGEDRSRFEGMEDRVARIERNSDASGQHQVVTLQQSGTWVKSAIITVGVALFSATVAVFVALAASHR